MNTMTMKLADIHPATYNPRKVLKPGDTEWEKLKGSLQDFGLVEPLIVNVKNGKNILVGGHQRYNVLKSIGTEETEVVVVELEEKEERQLNVALNRIEGMWDYEKLEVIFEELSNDEILKTGFSQNEIDDILKEIDEADSYREDEGSEETDNADDFRDENEQNEKPFQVFLSFRTQEAAEKWLQDREINLEFPNSSRNLTIKMEGTEYGTN